MKFKTDTGTESQLNPLDRFVSSKQHESFKAKGSIPEVILIIGSVIYSLVIANVQERLFSLQNNRFIIIERISSNYVKNTLAKEYLS